MWIDQRLINVTEGSVIHYGAIQRKIEELHEEHYIREIGFDRWGATKLSVDLTDARLKMVEFGQGYSSMSPPTKELLNLALSKKVRQGGNPVLRWMADSVEVKQNRPEISNHPNRIGASRESASTALLR